jgi:hypothetical protein
MSQEQLPRSSSTGPNRDPEQAFSPLGRPSSWNYYLQQGYATSGGPSQSSVPSGGKRDDRLLEANETEETYFQHAPLQLDNKSVSPSQRTMSGQGLRPPSMLDRAGGSLPPVEDNDERGHVQQRVAPVLKPLLTPIVTQHAVRRNRGHSRTNSSPR